MFNVSLNATPHYQIVDLESFSSFELLKNLGLLTVYLSSAIRRQYAPARTATISRVMFE